MKTKNLIKIISALIVTSCIGFNCIGPVYETAYASSKIDAQKILSNLTQEERKALEIISKNQGFGINIDTSIDLTSDEEISVIVEFISRPEKVAIVEAELNGRALSTEEARHNIDTNHDIFKSDLEYLLSDNTISYQTQDSKKGNKAYEIIYEYKDAFNGVSMVLPAKQVNRLIKSSVVKAVWSDEQVAVDIPIREDGLEYEQRAISNNPFIGVEKLHEEGITGKGIKVGVIDTGIDYNHPDLQKVYKGGYDFVDNDDDPMETTYEQWKMSGESEVLNGRPYYTEHGTHVAGIISGQAENESEYKVEGVAPDAELYAYRVLGPYGNGKTSNILKGIDRALQDGMDVMNLSLGADYNSPNAPTSIAINNVVLSGVTAVVAAGNAGDDMYTLGSPAAAALALTVGASDTPININTFKGELIGGNEAMNNIPADINLMAKNYSDNISELNGHKFDLVDVGEGGYYDYWKSGVDVKGKYVLVARGTYSLNDKVVIAYKNGAAGVLLYNNNPEEGHIPHFLGEAIEYVPTFSLTNETGITIKEGLANGYYEFSFNDIGEVIVEGDKLASFSSRGPSKLNYDVKPEIVAPGVAVMSTVPGYINDKVNPNNYTYAYQRLSGTSMAAPHVAGIAALMLQYDDELSPSEIKTVLMNTADPLREEYSVFETGAGRVDAYEAIHSDIMIEVKDETSVLLNDKEKLIKEQTGGISFGSFDKNGKSIKEDRHIVFHNNGKEDKLFSTEIKFTTGLRGAKDPQANGIELNIDSKINVNSNGRKETKVSISVPATAEIGIYEGYVVYTNVENSEENYQVPFAIRLSEDGIAEFGVSSQVMTTSDDSNMITSPATGVYFKLKSHMATMDVVVSDKNGNDLGFVGSIDPIIVEENIKYGYIPFYGYYYAFTQNKKMPISHQSTLLPEGEYILKLITTNIHGTVFEAEEKLYVDNTRPQFTTIYDDQVIIEFPVNNRKGVLQGNVYDDIVDINQAGIPISQTDNEIAVFMYTMSPHFYIKPDENGDFYKEIDLPLGSSRSVRLAGYDKATNVGGEKQIFFVEEGTPYIFGTLDKIGIKVGETIKLTVNAYNFKNVSKFEGQFKYPSSMEIVDVKKNPEFKEECDVNWEIKNGFYNDLELKIDLGSKTMNENTPMIDIYIKNPGNSYTITDGFLLCNTKITFADGKIKNPLDFIPRYYTYQEYSKVTAFQVSQGLLTEDDAINFNIDYTQIGAKAHAKDANGKVYEGEINSRGEVNFNLPISDEKYVLEFDIPGHFTCYESIDVTKKYNGVNGGAFLRYTLYSFAGDVNKDNVIDIMDALEIKKYWGTNNRYADINLDGVVDVKDMNLVEQNYLVQNPTVEKVPNPLTKYKGKILADIKISLGIN